MSKEIREQIDRIKNLNKVLVENEEYNYKDIQQKFNQKKQEFVNSIKTFDDLNDDVLYKFIDYYFDANESNMTDEEVFDDLKEKTETWKNFSDPVKLYRIVGAVDSESINLDEPGEHWTNIMDSDLQLSVGSELWDDDMKPYVVVALAPLSLIDVPQTLIQNLNYPAEWEVNLKNKGVGVKIIDVYPFH